VSIQHVFLWQIYRHNPAIRMTSMTKTLAIQNIVSSKGAVSDNGTLNKEGNSLSSLDIRRNGAVYTPTLLAQFVAKKMIGYFLDDCAKRQNNKKMIPSFIKKLRILDPACGAGELLFAAADALRVGVMNKFNTELPFDTDFVETLCGMDFDKNALDELNGRLDGYFSRKESDRYSKNLIHANALFPFAKLTPAESWQKIKNAVGATKGFDLVIANPPWGADKSSYNERLREGYYDLFRGQCDTSDLFIELILAITKPSGYFALIIPDSLFNGGREPLRKLLLEQSEIKFIGRMGEKIFPRINRGCAVVICKKCKPQLCTSVECLRLLPAWRKKILQGECSYEDVVRLFSHKVPQTRFQNNAEHLFDIDLRRKEIGILKKISEGGKLRDLVTASRGIELSKTGQVCSCLKCQKWMPMPSLEDPNCLHCGNPLGHMKPVSIISHSKQKGYRRMLAGESFSRYSTDSVLWIDPQKKGINYKSDGLYKPPKILVRKTGVSITATIDYSNAMTNQVVYMLQPLEDKKSFPLEVVLGLLNSRVIAYFLLKKFGEVEWRSHPYLTQEQILNLPIPTKLEEQKKHIQYICRILRPLLKTNKPVTMGIEARIERHIAALYGLVEEDYHVMYKAFESVEDLLPFRKLKVLNVCDIF